MKVLFDTARTYEWLYKTTGNKNYLVSLKGILKIIKATKSEAKQ